MKKMMTTGILAIAFTLGAFAQNAELKSIETTIMKFAKAADNNDVKALGECLDPSYRIVMNRLFGSKEVSVMNRDVYLGKIKSKEYGGDARDVEVLDITLNDTSAVAKVKMSGKMTFTSLLTLIKTESGDWKLVSDVPVIS